MKMYCYRISTYLKNAQKGLPTAIPEVLTKRVIFWKMKLYEDNDFPNLTLIKRGGIAWGDKKLLIIISGWRNVSTVDARCT